MAFETTILPRTASGFGWDLAGALFATTGFFSLPVLATGRAEAVLTVNRFFVADAAALFLAIFFFVVIRPLPRAGHGLASYRHHTKQHETFNLKSLQAFGKILPPVRRGESDCFYSWRSAPWRLNIVWMKSRAYAKAGVDIDLGNRVKATLPELLARARRPGVLGKIGGFGGLFALDKRRYRQPVLVSSMDGVGTKLKIAFAMNRHDTVGQDLVNHCVNDIVVLGAEPLFFLDYLGTGKLEAGVFEDIIKGFAKACAENRCALIGGETAQMPGFYQPGEYDLSGTIVGVVEKTAILGGRDVKPGDAVIGLASSGLHTNGYSLARKIFFEQLRLKPDCFIPELGCKLGDELLKIHISYGPAILALLKRFNRPGCPRKIKALAHITGGGFVDNIPRVLPKRCDVVIRKGSWPIPPVFQLLAKHGRLDEAELYQVFNMGVGMVVIVENSSAEAITRAFKAKGHQAWLIGEVVKGTGAARVVQATP